MSTEGLPQDPPPQQPEPQTAAAPASESASVAPIPPVQIAQSENAPAIVQVSNLPAAPSNNRPGYRFTNVELTEEEFHGSGVHKLMYQEIERLSAEVNDLKELRQTYHRECVTSATLQQKLTAATSVNEARDNARMLANTFLAVSMCAAGYFLSHADSLQDAFGKGEFWFFAFAIGGVGLFVQRFAK
jgi:hypothetical protein